MIRKNENIEDWEFNLFNAITDISDIESQKKIWLGKSPFSSSSFSEYISAIYDDFDFKRYIKYCNSIGENTFFCKLLVELDELISNYEPLSTDELILSDPAWLTITKKASEICFLDVFKIKVKENYRSK